MCTDIFCVCMYGGGLSRFRQLLHSSGRLFCVATVRCGKTLVIHDNRVRRRYIKVLLFVCLYSLEWIVQLLNRNVIFSNKYDGIH